MCFCLRPSHWLLARTLFPPTAWLRPSLSFGVIETCLSRAPLQPPPPLPQTSPLHLCFILMWLVPAQHIELLIPSFPEVGTEDLALALQPLVTLQQTDLTSPSWTICRLLTESHLAAGDLLIFLFCGIVCPSHGGGFGGNGIHDTM